MVVTLLIQTCQLLFVEKTANKCLSSLAALSHDRGVKVFQSRFLSRLVVRSKEEFVRLLTPAATREGEEEEEEEYDEDDEEEAEAGGANGGG